MQRKELTPILVLIRRLFSGSVAVSVAVSVLVSVSVFVSVSAHAQEPRRFKKSLRKPASVAGSYIDKNGVPRLADGSPDYSRFPNPFVVKKWTLEAQGGMGSAANGVGYQEYALGANAYFYSWLAWRNLAFYRPGKTAVYGLDMTERMSYELHRQSQFAVFVAPGFRFAGGGAAAPIGEAGVTIQIGGFTLGAGARSLMRSWIETAASNETQFFVTLSSGGRP